MFYLIPSCPPENESGGGLAPRITRLGSTGEESEEAKETTVKESDGDDRDETMGVSLGAGAQGHLVGVRLSGATQTVGQCMYPFRRQPPFQKGIVSRTLWPVQSAKLSSSEGPFQRVKTAEYFREIVSCLQRCALWFMLLIRGGLYNSPCSQSQHFPFLVAIRIGRNTRTSTLDLRRLEFTPMTLVTLNVHRLKLSTMRAPHAVEAQTFT